MWVTWRGPGGERQGFVDCLFLSLSSHSLAQFAEKFQEVKEAARLAREKSQDGGELTNPALGLTAHQVSPPCSVPAQHLTNIRGSAHCAGTQNQMLTDPWQRPWRKGMGAVEHVWG